MDGLRQDLRNTGRQLRKHPGFAAVAVLTLAVGIGANTAVFSVLNGVVLRPLPLPEPERVVNLGWNWGSGPSATITATKFEYWREHGRVFDGVTTFRRFTAGLPEGSASEAVSGLLVSDDFFRVAGLEPVLGRSFLPEEHRPGGPPVAVLSEDAWRTLFERDPAVLGREVALDGVPHMVVGVMPAGFRFPYARGFENVLRPLRLVADPRDSGHNYFAVARLRPGVSRADADAEVARVLAAFRSDHPDLAGNEQQRMELLGYQDIFVAEFRTLLWILLGAIGAVLVIACANVSNLMLARATARRQEIAVRLAIGASRGRIVRQLLTESLAMAVIAGTLGIALAVWGVDALLALSPEPLPRQEEIGIDPRVLAFTTIVACLTGLGFGLAAALPATRPDVGEALKVGVGGAGGQRNGRRLRTSLIICETAIAVVLLSGAGLLIMTFAKLRTVDTGFRTDELVVASFARAPAGMEGAETRELLRDQIVPELSRLPGVQSVALTSVVPFAGQYNFPMTVEGRPDASEGAIQIRMISAGYFHTMDVPLVRGRSFQESDRHGAHPVVIINEATARRHFPDEDPIGQRIQLGASEGVMLVPDFDDPAREIVGVVADVRDRSLRAPASRMLYLPEAQAPPSFATVPHLLVRTGRPAETSRLLPLALQQADARLPPPRIRTMAEIAGISILQERFVGTLLTVFAAIALLLTAVGIYGVVSYTARQRTREIGIRLAFGAQPGHVLRQTTSNALRFVAVGLALGLGAALFTTRLLEGIVYGLSTHDPVNFALVCSLLAGVALLASYLPARRAARVDPMISLRAE